jgi:hypothetical protein
MFYSDPKSISEFQKITIYKDEPDKLSIILKAVNWCSLAMREEALTALHNWAEIKNSQALSLLQHEIPDSEVRSYAVKKLSKISNRLLANYMPQLVQALKFEAFHSSDLGNMLLKRSLTSSRIVGHAYFWALNASLHD